MKQHRMVGQWQNVRHTFVGRLEAGAQVMVEEFIHEDGTRTVSVAFRDAPGRVWGPPVEAVQTS